MTEVQAIERIASMLASAGSALPWILLIFVLWAGRKGEFAFGRELKAAQQREDQWRLAAQSAQKTADTILGLLERIGGE